MSVPVLELYHPSVADRGSATPERVLAYLRNRPVSPSKVSVMTPLVRAESPEEAATAVETCVSGASDAEALGTIKYVAKPAAGVVPVGGPASVVTSAEEMFTARTTLASRSAT